MGIVLKEKINGDCILGIWEITEDYDSLYSRLNLEEDEIETLNSFKSQGRKLEWLSVRVLINDLTEKESRIIYNEGRKPFLKGNSFHISISHSYNLTSILISKTKRVGIDLEKMSHKISALSFKFINEQELITSDPDQIRYHLYLHWCAKEAIYKICDKQDINFRENVTIFPFIPKESGLIKGRVLNVYGVEDFSLYYKKYKDYSIVWTCKK
jgi:phosphopantetheinyl transferase (holo-ACP synthase)